MRESDKVNISAVSLFAEALVKYEESIVPGIIDPVQYEVPSRYFQMAMNRLISSNIPDSFQMMRILAERMISKSHPYTNPTILMLASGTPSSLAKDEILSVAYTLLQVIRGHDVVLDDLWFTRVNRNEAIKSFLMNYQTSDQREVCHCRKTNLVESQDTDVIIYSEDERLSAPIGRYNQNIVLTSNKLQSISCRLDSDLIYQEGYENTTPLTIIGSVTVKSSLNEFLVDKKIHFTDTAIEIMTATKCLVSPYSTGSDTRIKFPAPFFSIKLDMISKDSGTSWICGNIQILPPLLFHHKK